MTTARHHSTATLLPSGNVLISGGSNLSTGPVAHGEIYDPVSNTFMAAADLHVGRDGHTAELLPNGRVLVVGGFNGSSLASLELFQQGEIQQLATQSCGYEGHLKSITGDTPTAVRFVNTSTTQTFQVFWLNYSGQPVLYNTLAPGQSYVQSTFLTHSWVIADTSTSAVCQNIYLPFTEQAPAIFP